MSSGRLVEDGMARATTVLRRIAEGEMSARVDVTMTVDRDVRLRRRTLRLAGVVVALTALLELTAGPPAWGVNLFTAEAVLAGSAVLVLADSVRRLVTAD
jgi:hypothetical protein